MSETKASATTAYRDLLKKSSLGEELTESQCEILAGIITVRELEDGDVLFNEGDKDDALHVIAQGRLEVVRSTGAGEWVTLHILREGDMAGELSFVDGLEHSAGLRAVGSSKVFSLTRKQFEGLLQQDAELVYNVMRAIVRTVHDILRRMNLHYVEMSNYIAKQHGRY
jgi:CRP-like cAMP-binding protein